MLFQTVRFDPKAFRQRRPDGKGGWIWNLAGIDPVLYRLPELLSAPLSETVFVPEGEKDVELPLQARARRHVQPARRGKVAGGVDPAFQGPFGRSARGQRRSGARSRS